MLNPASRADCSIQECLASWHVPSVRCGSEIELMMPLSVSGMIDGIPDCVILVGPLHRVALLHTQGTALYARESAIVSHPYNGMCKSSLQFVW